MDDVDEHLDLVSDRAEVLGAMEDGPLTPRDLRDRTGDSRSTINRAIRELEDADLIRRDDGAYGLTAAGRLALDHHRRYRRDHERLLDAKPVLSSVPGDVDLDLDLVLDAEVVGAPEETPYRPVQRLHDVVDGTDRYTGTLPALVDPRHVRLLYEHVVTDGDPAELIVPEPLYDSLSEEFPRRLAGMADPDSGRFELLVGDVPNVGVIRTDTDGQQAVTAIVPGDDGGIRMLVHNDTPAALRRAEDRLERIRDGADPVTDELRQVGDGGAVVDGESPAAGASGPGIGTALEREGFVRLSREYFLDRDVAAPTTAWRTGLDVAEVHTGYAIERTTDDGETVSERLLSGLLDGRSHVLVGPPGSGKSTTAKQVACEWYDRDLGPVFHRESGRGASFRSVDDLVATVATTDGHALVVVEDAVRPDAAAVFEAARRLEDDADVSFLLDARESEWRDPPTEAAEAVADVDPNVESMPRLLDRDRERLIEHFERTANTSVDVSLDDLRDVGSADDTAPGEMLLVLHRLATYADPLAEDATSLEADAAAVYDTLVDSGDRALDVAVAANLLNAAGVDLTAAHLHAVVGPDGAEAVRTALDDLEGRVLFGVEADGTYRTVHEAWSAAFLTTLLDAEGEAAARDRVGRCASAVLSLADDPALREYARRESSATPTIERVAADPAAWADETVDALFTLGQERPKLAPLFGSAEAGLSIDLPAACESATVAECTARLGRMFLDAGAFDEARAVARRGRESVAGGSEADCRLLDVLAGASLEQGDYERARLTAERQSELAGDLEAPRYRRLALYRLGRIARERGEYDRAIERLQQCLDRAADAGDRRTAARARTELGLVAERRGDYDGAREHHEESLATKRDLGDRRGTAVSLGNLGTVALKQGEYDRAQEYHEQSLAIKREIGDRQGESNALGNLGVVFKRRGEYDRAREYCERDLAIKREIGDRQGEAITLRNLGNIAYLQGEYDRVREYEERSLAIKRDLGDRYGEAASLNNLGLVALKRGAYDRARERFEESVEIARDLGDRQGEAETLGNLATVAERQGEYDRAREYHEESLDIARDIGDRRGEASSLIALGGLALSDDRDERSRAHFTEALEIARDIEDPRLEGESCRGLGALARRREEYEQARERLDRAGQLFERIDAESFRARTRLETARLALAEGDTETAADEAETARDTFADLDEDYREAESRRLLGRVAAAAGDHQEARAHWQDALETFEAVGAPGDLLQTLELLVEHSPEVGDEDDTRTWCRRARSVLSGASEADVDHHREWIDRATTALED